MGNLISGHCEGVCTPDTMVCPLVRSSTRDSRRVVCCITVLLRHPYAGDIREVGLIGHLKLNGKLVTVDMEQLRKLLVGSLFSPTATLVEHGLLAQRFAGA